MCCPIGNRSTHVCFKNTVRDYPPLWILLGLICGVFIPIVTFWTALSGIRFYSTTKTTCTITENNVVIQVCGGEIFSPSGPYTGYYAFQYSAEFSSEYRNVTYRSVEGSCGKTEQQAYSGLPPIGSTFECFYWTSEPTYFLRYNDEKDWWILLGILIGLFTLAIVLFVGLVLRESCYHKGYYKDQGRRNPKSNHQGKGIPKGAERSLEPLI